MSVSDLNTTADRRRCRKHGDSHIRRRSYRDLTDTRRYLSTAQRIIIQSRTSIQLPFPSSRGFDSRPFRFQTTTLAGCTQRCASVTKQYNLVPVKGRRCPAAGEVTVGLASHWPRVTDFSGSSTYVLMAYGREMSTPFTLLIGYDTPLPFPSNSLFAVPIFYSLPCSAIFSRHIPFSYTPLFSFSPTFPVTIRGVINKSRRR